MYSKHQNNLSVNYISSGYIVSQKNWKHNKRYLDCFEIIYVTKGTLYIQEEEKQYVLSENDYIVLSPYKSSFGFMANPNKVSFYWVSFDTNDFAHFEISNIFSSCSNPLELTLLFEHLTNASFSPKYISDIYTALILNYISKMQKNARQKIVPIITEIILWIKSNANANLTVKSVSDKFGYNKDYLCRIFKQYNDIGLKKHINAEIIKRAKNLIITSDYSITQISAILQFENPNLFNKFYDY